MRHSSPPARKFFGRGLNRLTQYLIFVGKLLYDLKIKTVSNKTLKTQIIKWTTAFILAFLLFAGCRKQDNILPEVTQNYEELKSQFFDTNSASDVEIKKLAADIKKQDSIFKFLPDFVRKNGLPKWDKVIYKTKNSSKLNGRTNASFSPNSLNTAANRSVSTNNNYDNQGLFFIPLQSTNSQVVKSYITAYKHNDSLYTYRIYNKDSLNAIQPSSNEEKNKLLNTQAVFGYFEKSINNVDSVNIISPVNATLKHVNISFDTNPSSSNSNSITNSFGSTSGCTISISINISYSISIWSDGVNVVIVQQASVTMEIVIDCTGGGGGGGCGCGGTTGSPGGGSPSGTPSGGTPGNTTGGSPSGGSPSGGNTTGNTPHWWNYGTGWPWYGGSGGNTPLDWNWWWTSGGGGGVILPIEIIPDPATLGDFVDDSNIFEDDSSQITFNYDQTSWPIINNVLTPVQFVEYDYRNCLALAQAQIAKSGLRDLGYGSAFKVFDSAGGPYPSVAKAGVNYIITKLQSGKPVIAGVDNRAGTPSTSNKDGKTDHFITIVGSGQDSDGKYFTFFDNATNFASKGCHPDNKLYYNENTGVITGPSRANGAPPVYHDYIVTQIRKNQ